MFAPLREQFQEYHYTSAWGKYENLRKALEENSIAVITQDRVRDDNLKSKIKNRNLCTCRLFLLT